MTNFGLGFIQGTGGEIVDPADALIEAMEVAPSAEHEMLIRATVAALVSEGIWDKLDCLYFLAAHDDQAALINWKKPGTFDAELVGSPTFIANVGFTSTSGNHPRVPWNASVDAVAMTTTSQVLFSREMTNQAVNGVSVGCTEVGVAFLNLEPRTLSNAFRYRFGVSLSSDYSNTDSARLVASDRTGTVCDPYIAGADVGGDSMAVVALPNAQYMCIGGVYTTFGGGTFQIRANTRVGVCGWGAHLTPAQHAALNEIIETYLSGL